MKDKGAIEEITMLKIVEGTNLEKLKNFGFLETDEYYVLFNDCKIDVITVYKEDNYIEIDEEDILATDTLYLLIKENIVEKISKDIE